MEKLTHTDSPVSHLRPFFANLAAWVKHTLDGRRSRPEGDSLMSAATIAVHHARQDLGRRGLGNSIYCSDKLAAVIQHARNADRANGLDPARTASETKACQAAADAFLAKYESMLTQ